MGRGSASRTFATETTTASTDDEQLAIDAEIEEELRQPSCSSNRSAANPEAVDQAAKTSVMSIDAQPPASPKLPEIMRVGREQPGASDKRPAKPPKPTTAPPPEYNAAGYQSSRRSVFDEHFRPDQRDGEATAK